MDQPTNPTPSPETAPRLEPRPVDPLVRAMMIRMMRNKDGAAGAAACWRAIANQQSRGPQG